MRRRLPWALPLLALACNDDGTQAPSGATSTETSATSDASEASATSDASETSATSETTGLEPDMGPPPVGCTVDPVDAATIWPGLQDDGAYVLVNGRRTDSYGETVLLDGLGVDVALHPTAEVAYVTTASRYERWLYVIDRNSQAIVQAIDREDAYYGMLISPDGSRLYASNGVPGGIEYFDINVDGTVASIGEVAVNGWTAGMAQDADGSTLWVASFDADRITEIDTATMTITGTFTTGVEPWDLLYLDSRDELWATDFAEEKLVVYDFASESVVDTVALPTSPGMLEANADESRVFVAVTGADTIVALDSETREILATAPVAEDDFVDALDNPLPNSNVSDLVYDGDSDRLYAARGSDAAIGVFEASSLTPLGSIPTSWYPTGVSLSPDGGQLVVSELRANGTRSNLSGEPDDYGEYLGGASFITLDSFDLADATTDVVSNFRRPLELAASPEACGDDFPLPLDYAGSPVIEHVVLIVNENQTFDALFGLSGDALGVEADPDFIKWDLPITVNKRALAARFVIGDHFFTDAEESDSGHTFLTATHWTEYVERIQKDRDKYDVLGFYPTSQPAIPDRGNFFSWLLDNGKSIQIYGEVVGIIQDSSQGPVAQFSDPTYPGGMVVNYAVKDELKAAYVAAEIEAGELADFTFLSLPNDHGNGVKPGVPTPPSMTADTDYAVGIVVDAISHSPYWDKTVIFVMQDDPQGSDDHIDEGRSPLLVISPWVRPGYVSHAHYSFSSVFATIERLLGVPPLGRPDASAAPMWDMFTNVPKLEPYDAIPREYPEEFGDAGDPGVAASRCMDFRGPDRNPGLEYVVDHYLAWRRGELTAAEAEARIAADLANPERLAEAEEEREEELDAHSRALASYRALRERQPQYALPTLVEAPAALGPAADCPSE